MSGQWFTEPGTTGTLSVRLRDGDWFLDSPAVDCDVKCLFSSAHDLSESHETADVHVTVSKYVMGEGQGPNYLFASVTETGINDTDTPPSSSDDDSSPDEQTDTGGDNVRTLSQLTGSGDFVTVEAVIESITWVNKGDAGTPDIKGTVVDESVHHSVVFVVNDGVSYPYLEEGARFEFIGVKDHFYSQKDQIQMMITDNTEFNVVSSSSATSSTSSSSTTANPDNAELHQIASRKIGDTEFVESQQEPDSLVGSAKKRARKQHRDPAIDPKLRGHTDDDESS
ncbi:hypothetical protein [Haloferax larsenii]|uniref:Uncharacterized protein n=1 Tax=Haloferax larsenii TaxID=302484 RepID=A0A1H7QLT5_HALLR|nr:hypothetical protein [Haloferax larsenii]SEL48912.1 hypothetical protein SAMN04488691_10580 [Haloferax larsenii]